MRAFFWDSLIEEHLHYEVEQVHVLTALYGVACGNLTSAHHLNVAKSLELLKAGTLIVDDFLDQAPMRNGLPSVYSQKGPEAAVMIGEVFHSTALIEFCRAVEAIKPEVTGQAVCLFEETYRAVCLGQLEDRELQEKVLTHDAPTEADYFTMIKHTSAVFIQAPLLLAAILVGRPAEIVDALAKYGLKIGLAYQVRDDILDVVATPQLTGKPRAGDIRNRKKRLPLLRLRDACSDGEREHLLSLLNKKGTLDEVAVAEVIGMMEKHGSVESCKVTTANLCTEALAAVRGKLPGEELAQLETIAGLLTDFTCLTETERRQTVSTPR